MKHINKAISIAFILLIGIALGWFIKGENLGAVFKVYLPAMATLMAAYFGAKYAFDLQTEKEKATIKQSNIVNGNLAIFNILRMINNLLDYQKQIIDPVRNKPTSFLEMSPTLPSEVDNVSLNIEKLSFLLATDDPNILGELSIEESRYQRAMDAIKERSRIHRNEAQPLLDRAGIIHGGNYTFEEIKSALGNRLYTTLQQSTKQIVEHVDATIDSLREIGNKLHKALKGLYPNEEVTRIADPVPSPPSRREEP